MSAVRPPSSSLPQFAPTPQELDDVELLRMGVLAPSKGFEGPDGLVSLSAPDDVVARAVQQGGLEIIDPEGVPLAVVAIEDSHRAGTDRRSVVGDLVARPGTISRAFGTLYVPPSATRAVLEESTLTVAVDSPLTDADLEKIEQTAASRPLLFLVLTGQGRPQGMSEHGLIRATLAAADRFDDARVVATPAARRADPAADRDFLATVLAAYAPGPLVLWPSHHGRHPPDIAKVLEADRPTGYRQGVVLFFTGLSGSGKSTIAQGVRNRLLELGSRSVSLLDGDRVRRNLSRGLTFSREDRETNIERIGWVAAEIARHGGLAVCSPIAPFERTRQIARQMAEDAGAAFILVHVSTPIAECERRDRKGLYARARRGDLPEFTGISSPYEVPVHPDLTIDTTDQGIDEVRDQVLGLLVTRKLLPPLSETAAVGSGRT